MSDELKCGYGRFDEVKSHPLIRGPLATLDERNAATIATLRTQLAAMTAERDAALARECGADVTMPNQAWFGADKGPLSLFTEPQLLAFTAAIIERCAVACEERAEQWDVNSDRESGEQHGVAYAATIVRELKGQA